MRCREHGVLAGREEQIVVWNLHVRTIGRAGDHIALALIKPRIPLHGLPWYSSAWRECPEWESPSDLEPKRRLLPGKAKAQTNGDLSGRAKSLRLEPSGELWLLPSRQAASNDHATRQFLIHRPAWESNYCSRTPVFARARWSTRADQNPRAEPG